MITQCIVCFLCFDHSKSIVIVGKSNYVGILVVDIQLTAHTHYVASLTYIMIGGSYSYHGFVQ